jgi:hypothetical protein
VTLGGRLLLFVPPPVATDAAGERVAARYGLDGDVLTLEVQHRAASVTYPVLADPPWLSSYDFQSASPSGFEGWGVDYNPDDPSTPDDDDDWYYALGTTEPGAIGHPDASGLWIIPRGGKEYTYTPFNESHGPGAIIFWGAPGASTITGVTFTGFRYRHYQHPDGRGDGQAARLAVYPGSGPPTYTEDFYGTAGERNDVTIQTPRPLAPGGKSVTFWLYTADCGTGAICRWQVPSSTLASWAMVGGAIIELDDPAPPTATLSGPVTQRGEQWVNRSTGDLDARHEASDNEGGVAGVQLETQLRGQTAATNASGVQQPDCDPAHHTPGRISAICQQAIAQTLTFDPQALPAGFGGWVNFQAYARDYAGNETRSARSTLWVDRDPPDAQLTGDIWERRGQWLNASHGHELSLTGEDLPGGAFSGVKRYEVTYSLQPSQQQPEQPQPALEDFDACPAAQPVVSPPADWHPCPRVGPKRTFSLDLPEGRNRFVSDLADFAANTTADGDPGHRDFEVYVDQTRPAVALSGSMADANGSWMSPPDDSLDLAVETSDNLSGNDEVNVRLETSEGSSRTLLHEDLCPDPQPGFTPCAKATRRVGGSVAGPELRSGETRVEIRAGDYAGNTRERTIRLHLDSIRPTVELRGDLLDMQGELAAPTQPVTAIVDASDDYSGIAAIELYLRDAQGSERLLRRADTCSATPAYTGAGSPCPLTVVMPFEIMPAEIGEGRHRLIARAVEFTGKTDSHALNADLDLSPPAAPVGLVVRTDPVTDQTTVTFQPGAEPPGSASIDHYVISVVASGIVVSENISQHPYATIGGIPPGLNPMVLVQAVDAFDREGAAAAAVLAQEVLEENPEPNEDDLELGGADDPDVAHDNPYFGALMPEDFTDGGPDDDADDAGLRRTRRILRGSSVVILKRNPYVRRSTGKPAFLFLLAPVLVVAAEALLYTAAAVVTVAAVYQTGGALQEYLPSIGGTLTADPPYVRNPKAGETVPISDRAVLNVPAGLMSFGAARALVLRYNDVKRSASKRRRQAARCWNNAAYARKQAGLWTFLAESERRSNSKLSTRIKRTLTQRQRDDAVFMDAHHIIPKIGHAVNFEALMAVKCTAVSLKTWPNEFTNGVFLPGVSWVRENPRKRIPRTDHRAISHSTGETGYAVCLRQMFRTARTVADMKARLILTGKRLELGTLVRARYKPRPRPQRPLVDVGPARADSCSPSPR